MAKVLLDYDPTTGWIADSAGMNLYCMMDLPVYTEPEKEVSVSTELTIIQLIDLKAAGYSVSDLADMKRAGLL
jgi:hypothetical protein